MLISCTDAAPDAEEIEFAHRSSQLQPRDEYFEAVSGVVGWLLGVDKDDLGTCLVGWNQRTYQFIKICGAPNIHLCKIIRCLAWIGIVESTKSTKSCRSSLGVVPTEVHVDSLGPCKTAPRPSIELFKIHTDSRHNGSPPNYCSGR